MSGPRISMVVAAARNGVIGHDGGLPWHLPDDLKHFKRVTMGHAIVMGRRTHDAIGRALPGRRNLVLTRSSSAPLAEGCIRVLDRDAALEAARDEEWLHVVGGATIYELFLPQVEVMHFTLVEAEVEGDTVFPTWDRGDWELVEDEPHPPDARHALGFRVQVWRRR